VNVPPVSIPTTSGWEAARLRAVVGGCFMGRG
jgi:hypothetical protein